MILSTVIVLGSLALILGTVVWRGLPALNLDMITQTPKGGYYLGKEGGILNAIVGSLYLAGGATILALLASLPIALYLQMYARRTGRAEVIRLALDVLWGVPSIVYGAFGFIIMLWLGIRASLLAGIIALTLLELPIMVRAMDETIAMVPWALKEASYALGATRLETAVKVVVRQTAPGLVTAMLLPCSLLPGTRTGCRTRFSALPRHCRSPSFFSSALRSRRCRSAPTPRPWC